MAMMAEVVIVLVRVVELALVLMVKVVVWQTEVVTVL